MFFNESKENIAMKKRKFDLFSIVNIFDIMVILVYCYIEYKVERCILEIMKRL